VQHSDHAYWPVAVDARNRAALPIIPGASATTRLSISDGITRDNTLSFFGHGSPGNP